MNQVPWRRILERAADDGPGDRGASVINLRDHAPDRQAQRRPQPTEAPEVSPDLESELQRALDRANRPGGRDQGATRQAQRTEPPPRSRAQPRSAPMLRPDMDMHQAPLVLPQYIKKRNGGNGARNLLAISLSAVVIGFAFYQIGHQWSDIGSSSEQAGVTAPFQDQFASTQTAASAAPQSGKSADRIEADVPRAAFDGKRLDLRPSLATEPATTRTARAEPANRPQARQLPPGILNEDIEEAARLMERAESKQIAAVAPAAVASPSAEGMEEIMLRRGHDMVQQGRVESARLVFEHLAEQKSALGAFALAQTYDARFLHERGIRDVSPDPSLAAKWYQAAAELTTLR